jgi:leader peptidase (prepilin peptidase) / N-methyltransferase
MFNLEHSIADWRIRMLAAGIQTPVPLEELEIHLREEIGRQMKSGSNIQQAFESAVQRIGQAKTLKSEFAKVGGTKRKVIWFLLTTFAFAGCWIQFSQSPAVALVYCVFLAGLIAASFIDFKHFVIPDKLTVGGILAGFFCSTLLPQLHGQKLAVAGMFQSLLGICAGAALAYFILRTGKLLFGRQRIAFGGKTKIIFTETAMLLPEKTITYAELFYRKSDAIELQAQSVQAGNRSYQDVSLRLTPNSLKIGEDTFSPDLIPHLEAVGSEIVLPREAMGLGDVKLMAAVGAFLGWQAVIFSLMASSLIGSFVGVGLVAARRREWSSRLPYGPWIALAAVIWIFGGSRFFDMMFGR